MNENFKIGFVTCVDLGKACLQAIYQAGYKVEVAITLKDENAQNKSGRTYIDDLCYENKTDLLKVDLLMMKIALNSFKAMN